MGQREPRRLGDLAEAAIVECEQDLELILSEHRGLLNANAPARLHSGRGHEISGHTKTPYGPPAIPERWPGAVGRGAARSD